MIWEVINLLASMMARRSHEETRRQMGEVLDKKGWLTGKKSINSVLKGKKPQKDVGTYPGEEELKGAGDCADQSFVLVTIKAGVG